MLTVRDAATAAVLVSLTHSHLGKQAKYTNLVTFRTTDGGEN